MSGGVYKIHVQANVENTYGANVYAFAMKTPAPNTESVIDFLKTSITNNGEPGSGVVQMQRSDNATVLELTPSVSGNVVSMECDLLNMFANVSSTTTHTIPYAFSEYHVYVVARNNLNLFAAADGGVHNEYTLVNEVTTMLTNATVTYTQGVAENVVTVDTTIENTTVGGNVFDYYTVGFVDDDVTPDMASWYVDQYILEQAGYGTNGAVKYHANVVSADPMSKLLTSVVKDVTDPASVFDVNDVNNAKVYLIARDVGPLESRLTGVDYHATQVTSVQETATESHARIKNMYVFEESTDQWRLTANVTGYNSVDALGVPTFIKVLFVERNGNVLDTTNLTSLVSNIVDEHGETANIADGQMRQVYELSVTAGRALANIVDNSPVFANIDPFKEYDALACLDTSNDNHLTTYMLTDVDQPVHNQWSHVLIEDTLKPGAVLSDLVFDETNQKVLGNVTFESHRFVDSNTSLYLVASVVPNIMTGSNVAQIPFDEAYAFANIEAGANVSNTFAFEFTKAFTSVLNGNVANVEDVHAVHLYPYVKVDNLDTGYTFERLENTSVVVRPGGYHATDDDFYARVDSTSVGVRYDTVYANVHSVFNNSPTGVILDRVYAFVTHSDDVTNPETLLGNLDTHFDSVGGESDGFGARFTDLSLGQYDVHVFDEESRGDLAVRYVFSPSSPAVVDVVQPNVDYTLHVIGTDNVGADVFFANKMAFNVSNDLSSGVKNLVGNFEPVSGNIELTGGDVFVEPGDDGTLNLVAFTYDVREQSAGNIDLFQSTVYDASATSAVVQIANIDDGTTVLGSTGNVVYLDHVIDSNLDVENAFATRYAFVYGWVSSGNDPLRKSSVFEMTPALDPGDRFYPFIQVQDENAYDGNVMTVTDASVVESNIVSGQPDQKVDKYYIFGFDKTSAGGGGSFPDDTALLTTFGPVIQEGNIGFLGEFNDIEPNVDTNDIYVAGNVTFTHVFTSYTDPTLYDVFPIDANVELVLLAVNAPSGTAKSFVREFRAGVTVPGVRNLVVSFSGTHELSITGGTAYGNTESGETLHVAAYTYELDDPRDVPGSMATFTLTPGSLPRDFGTSNLSLSPTLNQLMDINGDMVDLANVDNVHVYAWVGENNNDNQAKTTASAQLDVAATGPVFTRLTKGGEDTNTETFISASIFTSQIIAADQIDNHYVALFEDGVADGLTETDIRGHIVTHKDTATGAIFHTLDANIAVYDAVTVGPFAFTHALANVDTGATNPLSVGTYDAYILTEWNDGANFQLGNVLSVEREGGFAVHSVTASLVTTAGGGGGPEFGVDVETVVSGSLTNEANVYASVYMFPEPAELMDPNPHKVQLVGPTTPSLAIGETFVSIPSTRITQAVDGNGTLVNIGDFPGLVSTLYVYVWVEDVLDPAAKSTVTRTTVSDTGSETEPYPKIHDAQIVHDEIRTGAGNVISLFDPTANITGYYVAAFHQSTAATLISNSNMVPFVTGNVGVTTQTVNRYELGYGAVPFAFTEVFSDPADASAKSPVFTREAYQVVVVAENDLGEFGWNAFEFGSVTSNAGVKNFAGALDMVEGNIDIDTVDLYPPAAGGTPTDFYVAAFTYDVLAHVNHDLAAFNTIVRANGSVFATGITSDSVNNTSYANVLGTMFDTEGEEVPVSSSNVAYMYAWANVLGTADGLSAVTPSSTQFASINPYPRIRSATGPTTGADANEIEVTGASVFSPASNIDMYYLFAVDVSAYTTLSEVSTFVTSGNILNNTIFANAVGGRSVLGEFNDFDPDLLEGNVYMIDPLTIEDAFTDLSDANVTTPFVSGNSYDVFLVSTDDDQQTNLYKYPTTFLMTGVSLNPPDAIYVDALNTQTANEYRLSFTFDDLLSDWSTTVEYYAVVSVLPTIDRDMVDTILGSQYAPEPFVTVSPGENPQYNQSFTITHGYDIKGDRVNLHTVAPTYMFLFSRTHDGSAYGIASNPVGNQSIQTLGVFGTPPETVASGLGTLFEARNRTVVLTNNPTEIDSASFKFLVREKLLFTAHGTTINTFKREFGQLYPLLDVDVGGTIVDIAAMQQLPYMVYAYTSVSSVTTFRLVTYDTTLKTTALVGSAITTDHGKEIVGGSLVMNDAYMVHTTTDGNVCAYAFDETKSTYTHVDTFNRVNGEYDISSANTIVSDIITPDGTFAIADTTTTRNIYIMKPTIDGTEQSPTTYNNVIQVLDFGDSGGNDGYPIKVVFSKNGKYLFVSTSTTTKFAGSVATGVVYVYTRNDTTRVYVKSGYVAEDTTVANTFGSSMVSTGYHLVVFTSHASSTGFYMYTFGNSVFDFSSGKVLTKTVKSAESLRWAVFEGNMFVYQVTGGESNFVELYPKSPPITSERVYPPCQFNDYTHEFLSGTASLAFDTGITVTNVGGSAVTSSSWNVPFGYVSYGTGTYVATNSNPANNVGHYVGGSFARTNRTNPFAYTNSFGATTNGWTVGLSLPVGIKPSRYIIYNRLQDDNTPQGWLFQVSSDNTNWVTVDTQTSQNLNAGSNKAKEYVINHTYGPDDYYYHVRVNVTTGASSGQTFLPEVAVFGYEKPPPPNGWELLHRDVADQSYGITIVNSGTVNDGADFGKIYSRLGDMKNGLMDTSEYKEGGTYKFRWVVYLTSGETTRYAPEDAVFFFQWEQTKNPTLTPNGNVTGMMNLIATHPVHLSLGTAYEFNGLYLNSNSAYGWLSGTSTYDYTIGRQASNNPSSTTTRFSTTSHSYRSELYLWKGSRPDPTVFEVPGEWVLLCRQTTPIVVRTATEWKTENWNEDDPSNDNYSIIPMMSDLETIARVTQNGQIKYYMKLVYYKADGSVDAHLQFKQTSHPFTESTAVGGENVVITGETTTPRAEYGNALALSSFSTNAVWDASPTNVGWFFPVGQLFTGTKLIAASVHDGTVTRLECYIHVPYHPANDVANGVWTLRRSLPAGSTTWYPDTDNLTEYIDEQFNEFLFTSADFSHWLVCDKDAVYNGNPPVEYENAARPIKVSSVSQSPYTAGWYGRHLTIDPLIVLEGDWASVGSTPTGDLLYAADSYSNANRLPHPSGMRVYTRWNGYHPANDVANGVWELRRSLPAGSTTWYPDTDQLTEYINEPFNEFLFTSADFSHWLVCDKDAVYNGNPPVGYDNAARPIKVSSVSQTPYTADWYNGADFANYPLIVLEGNWVISGSTPTGDVLYVQNSYSNAYHLPHPSGMRVYTRWNGYHPLYDEAGGVWKLDRSLAAGSTTWYPDTDRLFNITAATTFTEFLFTTGDFSSWLICDKDAVLNGGVDYNNVARTIKRSSISQTPYTANWYNRAVEPQDPLIVLDGDWASRASTTVMYAGNGAGSGTTPIHPSGMRVYVR